MAAPASGSPRANSLSEIAKLGFESLSAARTDLERLTELVGKHADTCTEAFAFSASPDRALAHLLRLLEVAPSESLKLVAESDSCGRLMRLLGASEGVAEAFLRQPETMEFLGRKPALPNSLNLATSNRVALRVSYRQQLARIADWDLSQESPEAAVTAVVAALSDLADAALEAGLALAKSELLNEGRISQQDSEGTQLAVISMGKCGARELNYVSDVDVIYVGSGTSDNFIDVGTKIAQRLALVINESDREPGLWEVDPNLRPEGKAGALVRTVDAHVAYYEKWAKSWEFQALLKARVSAGDAGLGAEYLDRVCPLIWTRHGGSNIVQDARAMRKRVIENIPVQERDQNLKLGRGGLRDVEFTVQLLQLVHGVSDPNLRSSGTFEAIAALSEAGLLSRQDAADLQLLYRRLRAIEHRLQLVRLRRTHLVPVEESELRRIARALHHSFSADDLQASWIQAKAQVAKLHDSVFYRPLLSATADLDPGEVLLSDQDVESRLRSLGFLDPEGANRHLKALSQGVSRRATIQRSLLPVLIRWMAEGVYPDRALLSFRRLSEQLGDAHWFLKMLRDSSGAAERLMRVLASSNFIARLLEYTPESSSWFGEESQLVPSSRDELEVEALAILKRSQNPDKTAESLRVIRRREVLRIAIGATLGVTNLKQISSALSDVSEVYLSSMMQLALRSVDSDLDVGIVAMGRLGGKEQGFGSDADVILVYRSDSEFAQRDAESAVAKLLSLVKDSILEFEIDLDLRPEGKNGPRIKSLAAYAGYYEKWAETWEFQALLRARTISGTNQLQEEFTELIDKYRYPTELSNKKLVDIRLMKARVENERLPQGADAARHLKLGKGAVSDIEWLVQFLQLRYVGQFPGLKGLGAIENLHQLTEVGKIDSADAAILEAAWTLASRLRSAQVLAGDRSNDQLPIDRSQLEAMARILEFAPGSATELEELYLATTRKARIVFERLFAQ